MTAHDNYRPLMKYSNDEWTLLMMWMTRSMKQSLFLLEWNTLEALLQQGSASSHPPLTLAGHDVATWLEDDISLLL